MAVPAVVDRDGGPKGLRVTADPPHGLLRGVSVTAQADGRYAIDLCLISEIVPLHELADEVVGAVERRFSREGLQDLLGTVSVEFSDVLTAAEIVDREVRKREQAIAAIAAEAAQTPPPAGPAGPAGVPPTAPVPPATAPVPPATAPVPPATAPVPPATAPVPPGPPAAAGAPPVTAPPATAPVPLLPVQEVVPPDPLPSGPPPSAPEPPAPAQGDPGPADVRSALPEDPASSTRPGER